MSKPPPETRRRSRLWAWFFFLLALASAYVFFVLPHQMNGRTMRVEFTGQ